VALHANTPLSPSFYATGHAQSDFVTLPYKKFVSRRLHCAVWGSFVFKFKE